MRRKEKQPDTHTHTHTKMANCTIVAHAKRLVAISRLYTHQRRHILELELVRARDISWLAAVDEMRNNNSFSILPIASFKPRFVVHLFFPLAFSQSHYIKMVERYRFETISNFISPFETIRFKVQ